MLFASCGQWYDCTFKLNRLDTVMPQNWQREKGHEKKRPNGYKYSKVMNEIHVPKIEELNGENGSSCLDQVPRMDASDLHC